MADEKEQQIEKQKEIIGRKKEKQEVKQEKQKKQESRAKKAKKEKASKKEKVSKKDLKGEFASSSASSKVAKVGEKLKRIEIEYFIATIDAFYMRSLIFPA